ncbi:uncharacterized protein N7482_008151 [Penicillium canariense]|uniref:Uncharacterized protein n=1 Tax=Penicillium canariense TaxID=189055 RepID=A0A9W9HT80_9EURO|nr:uncharacterized protein N7482_008151 [Penicillium canariense]KAJ5157051.1 hypothetical protein N7482_008151 [Penicillium canariense]
MRLSITLRGGSLCSPWSVPLPIGHTESIQDPYIHTTLPLSRIYVCIYVSLYLGMIISDFYGGGQLVICFPFPPATATGNPQCSPGGNAELDSSIAPVAPQVQKISALQKSFQGANLAVKNDLQKDSRAKNKRWQGGGGGANESAGRLALSRESMNYGRANQQAARTWTLRYLALHWHSDVRDGAKPSQLALTSDIPRWALDQSWNIRDALHGPASKDQRVPSSLGA